MRGRENIIFKMKPLKIIFFGTDQFVVSVLESLAKNFEVKAVVTIPDREVGRKKELTPSAVAQAAERLEIPVLKPSAITGDFIKNHRDQLTADLYVVASYGAILPENLLNIPKFGALNIHPSSLPKYRGPSPMPAAILAGDEMSGITIIKMDEKMDHGPIVYTEQFRLSKQDNFEMLSEIMFGRAAKFLPQVIDRFTREKKLLQPQNEAAATYCKQITKQDGYFDLDNPPSPEQLDRMIRAYYPWPTAWTVWRVNESNSSTTAKDNKESDESKVKERIVKFLPDGFVQLEGKNAIPLKDFLNGYPDFPEPLVQALKLSNRSTE